MKGQKYFLVGLFTALLIPAAAQWKISGVELGTMPGAGLHEYTSDSLVFERRRNLATFSGSVQMIGMLTLSNRKHSRSNLQFGLGWRNDAFTMNKNNVIDALASIIIIPFGGRPSADTFALSSVGFRVQSLTVPLAYDYNLTRNSSNAVHVHFRALVVPGIVLSRNVSVVQDTTIMLSNPPDAAAISALRTEYQEMLGPFSLYIAPEINLTGRQTPGKLNFAAGIQPFAFDLFSYRQQLYKGSLFLRFNCSLSYRWR